MDYCVQDVLTGGYINEYSFYQDEQGRKKMVIYTGVVDGFRAYSNQTIDKRFEIIQRQAKNLGIHREFRIVENSIEDTPWGERIILIIE